MRQLQRAVLVVAIAITAPATARAEPEPENDTEALAPAYARRSTTLFVSTELSPPATVSGQLEVGASLRLHRRSLAARASLGVAYAFSPVGGGNLYGGRIGGALGASVPVGCRVSLTPMAAYDLFLYRQDGSSKTFVIHRLTVELPVTFVIHRRVVIEAFVQGGLAYLDGTRDLALAIGPRIGAVF